MDSIDLQQFHVWEDNWAQRDEWKSATEKLTREGKVKAWGVSVNRWEPDSCLETLRTGMIDAVQVIYNIFDQSPERELFPLCQERNVGVIARVPLDEGGLTGKVNALASFPQGDWRMRYFRDNRREEVAERVAKLEPVVLEEAKTLPEGAIRFCLSHPAVSTVIPGMRTPEHARSNTAISDGRLLSKAMLARLKTHAWDRNFYQ